MIQRFLRILPILVGLSMLSPVEGMAETPFPRIHEPEAEGVKCVQPEEEMRRNHMKYILHQRDKTMHEGIRTETYSLSACIDCHVEPDANGQIASHDSKEHFCGACHEYASVQIDCFECHADKPQKYIKRSASTHALEKQLKNVLAVKSNAAKENDGSDL